MARPKEQTLYGLRACLAVADRRPHDILRAFHTPERRGGLGPLLSSLAQRRRPYREVDADELRRIAGTPHHEGVALVCVPLVAEQRHFQIGGEFHLLLECELLGRWW